MREERTRAVEVKVEINGLQCGYCVFACPNVLETYFCKLFGDVELETANSYYDFLRCPECLATFPSEGE